MGAGEGGGEGVGEGSGGGKGESRPSDENIVIGSALAIGLTVFMCVCGIPLIIAGVVMILIFDAGSGIYIGGVAIVVISGILLIVAIVFIVLICTGVIGQKAQSQTQTTQVITTTSYPAAQGAPPQQYPAYTAQPQPGGQQVVMTSYPPAQQPYPQYSPQQPQYPPAQMEYPPQSKPPMA